MNSKQEKALLKAFKTINELLLALNEGDAVIVTGYEINGNPEGSFALLLNNKSLFKKAKVNKRTEITHYLSIVEGEEVPLGGFRSNTDIEA